TLAPARLGLARREDFGRALRAGLPRLRGRVIRLRARRRDGGEVPVDLRLSGPVGGEGGPIALTLRPLVAGVDDERRRAVARSIQATARAAAELGSRQDLDGVLRAVVGTLVDQFDAALARVWLAEPETGRLVLHASAGLSERVEDSPRRVIDPANYPFKMA